MTSATIARSEDISEYKIGKSKESENIIIQAALLILQKRMKITGAPFNSPDDVKNFCRLKIGHLEHEVFSVLFLDAQNRMIEFCELFRGTITQTSVYPREVVKMSLALNAASVIFTHNHPSGTTTPSRADEMLTSTLKSALALVDVRVLDHFIVSATGSLSMAETGLI